VSVSWNAAFTTQTEVSIVQAIEGDMDVMIKYFDELNDLGAQLVQQVGSVDDDDATQAVNGQLHDCQDRWDNLIQRMQHCSKQVSQHRFTRERRQAANRARQLYKNISILFLFPVKDGKLSTGVIAIFNASCYG